MRLLVAGFQISALEDKASSTFIDTCAGEAELRRDLKGLQAQPPSLYSDPRGSQHLTTWNNLILQIFVPPKRSTFLIDVRSEG